METCRTGRRDLISNAADRAASGVLNERFVRLTILELIALWLFFDLFRLNNLLGILKWR